MNLWIDIDNAPHVLVLHPLIRELEARGHRTEITARDFGQTFSLLELHGLKYQAIGRHAGSNKLKKGIELLRRSFALLRYARSHHFGLALCHGSRGLVLPTQLLGIPLVVLLDYEYTFNYPFRQWACRILMPEVIPDEELKQLGFDLSRLVKYPGLKEELYVYDFQPDPTVLNEIGVDPDKVLVVMRPPATMAHYHSVESERLFWSGLSFLCKQPHVQIILLPRTAAQGREIRAHLNSRDNVTIPEKPVYGPNLFWHADLVISGGGTMNREAACLGVPVYSIFRGSLGAVDRHLTQCEKLTLIEWPLDIERIRLEKRVQTELHCKKTRSRELVQYVTTRILEVAKAT
jgi:predicted glycosyltransferase